MIGFEIKINDGETMTIASEGIAFLLLSYGFESALDGMDARGSDERYQYKWLSRHATEGDRITIRVVETSKATAPVSVKERKMEELIAEYQRLKEELHL